MADTEKNRDGELFSARIAELASRAERGVMSASEFLSPREVKAAEVVLAASGFRDCCGFYGGYEDAERRRLFCVPEYMLDMFDDAGENGGRLRCAVAYAAEGEISVLRAEGSGYRELGHRDFLGTILSLGIKRGMLGDIIVDEDAHGAYIFCDGKICAFLTENLVRVANDTVKTSLSALPEGFSAKRKTEPISDTLASPRADSVISSLLHVSRERAKERIVSGLVEVNYEPMTKPDEKLEEGDVISVRGSGKYRIVNIGGKTRSGRLRLLAEKYI